MDNNNNFETQSNASVSTTVTENKQKRPEIQ